MPQGSILGPLPFCLYLLPLRSILRKYGIAFHFYADDSQIYMPLKQENGYSADPLFQCISEVKAWMSMNFLHLKYDKTEVMLFGPTDGSTVPVDLGLLSQHLKPVATNLCVKLVGNLKFDAQVSGQVQLFSTETAY